ncbi:MAG: hypothetical protein HQL37_00215 [Alphaproteobacteria bacterium]|nr:hypothetical protein [Alphaproteobacteria bacterium]
MTTISSTTPASPASVHAQQAAAYLSTQNAVQVGGRGGATPSGGERTAVRDVVDLSQPALSYLTKQNAAIGQDAINIRVAGAQGRQEAQQAAVASVPSQQPQPTSHPAAQAVAANNKAATVQPAAANASSAPEANTPSASTDNDNDNDRLASFAAQPDNALKGNTGVVNAVTQGVSSQQISFLV